MAQSGSISKFQCERLFGSFQSIVASTTRRSPSADIDFLFCTIQDIKPGASQQSLDTRPIGYPPVGRIVGIAVLDKLHGRKTGLLKYFSFRERVVLLHRLNLLGAAHQGLKDQQVPYN